MRLFSVSFLFLGLVGGSEADGRCTVPRMQFYAIEIAR